MGLKLLDCTLRDGANVVGGGFDAETTDLVLKALTENKVSAIEYGHPSGIGGNEGSSKKAPLSDDEYLALAVPYLGRGTEIGMFAQPKWSLEPQIKKAAKAGLNFLRVGCNAGSGDTAEAAVKNTRNAGMTVRFSMMKAYVLTTEELAEEAFRLQNYGAQSITIMDSAGTMTPEMVRRYVSTLNSALDVPVGFHGHNNLGLSAANSLAALESGARELDACLMGMARSAGNTAIEVLLALLQRDGKMMGVNFRGLLSFIENVLAAKVPGYHAPVAPLDLILGLAGCHSNYLKRFKAVAEAEKADLYDLIIAVSAEDRGNPSDDLLIQKARSLKAK